MPIELVKEKYSAPIYALEIGRPGAGAIKVGGETALPFLFEEGDMPNRPVVAYEILDCEPQDWPEDLKKPFGSSIKDPIAWAKKCVSDFSAKLLCVRMQSVHPDWKNASSDEAVKTLKTISKEVKVPLIIRVRR